MTYHKLKRSLWKYFFGLPGSATMTAILLGFLIFLGLYCVAYNWPIQMKF